MLLGLFEKGVVIHRAWMGPIERWEYSVQHSGETTASKSIAIRKSLSAAYNAAVNHLSTQHGAEPTCPSVGKIRQLSTTVFKDESPAYGGSRNSKEIS